MCPLIPLLNSLLIGGEIRSRVWGKSHIFSFLEKIKKIPLYSVHVALLVSWPISSATTGKLLPKKLLTSFFMQWGNFNSIWMRTVFHLQNRLPKYPHCDVVLKNLAGEHSKCMFLIHINWKFEEHHLQIARIYRIKIKMMPFNHWRSHFVPIQKVEITKKLQRMSFSGDTPCVKANNDIGLLPKIACRAHNQNLWTGNPQRLLSQTKCRP